MGYIPGTQDGQRIKRNELNKQLKNPEKEQSKLNRRWNKGVNMDHAWHVTVRLRSSSSFCNRRHPKAQAGSCSSDPTTTRLLWALPGSGGGRCFLREGEEGTYLDHSLNSSHLFCVISSSPCSLLTHIWLPGGSPWWGTMLQPNDVSRLLPAGGREPALESVHRQPRWTRLAWTGPQSPVILVNWEHPFRTRWVDADPRAAWPPFCHTSVLWKRFWAPRDFVQLSIWIYIISHGIVNLSVSSYVLSSFLLSPSPDGRATRMESIPFPFTCGHDFRYSWPITDT